MPAGKSTEHTLTTWQTRSAVTGEDAEALRVVYVAATRARRLLGLAVPATHVNQLLIHLERHNIPSELR
jgi:ATP-dependent exoDNAse (exonuclease V) beta subunit